MLCPTPPLDGLDRGLGYELLFLLSILERYPQGSFALRSNQYPGLDALAAVEALHKANAAAAYTQ